MSHWFENRRFLEIIGEIIRKSEALVVGHHFRQGLVAYIAPWFQNGGGSQKALVCDSIRPSGMDLYYWAIQQSWFARVNSLCNLSCKKSQKVTAHFQADFWVGIASRKQYKCQYCCSCKNYPGGWGKSVFASFFCWPEDHKFVEKMRFGASHSTSNKLLLIARHIMTTGLQKCL